MQTPNHLDPADNEFKVTKPAPQVSYGLASIRLALLSITHYPIHRKALIENVGKHEIYWNWQESMMLEDILSEIPQNCFESEEELTEAILSVIRLSFGDHSVGDQSVLFET